MRFCAWLAAKKKRAQRGQSDEEAAARAGVPIHTRFRAEQAPFHASLFNARPQHTVDVRDVATAHVNALEQVSVLQ